MLKVAFIDDGVVPIFKDVDIKYFIVEHGKVFSVNGSNIQKHSHATTCVAIFLKYIQKYVNKIQIVSIKVLDQKGNGLLNNVVSAINWAVDNNIKVINLSLGGTHFLQSEMYCLCIKKAQSAKSIIVAAQSNDNKYTFPASLPNVIGVKSSNVVDANVHLNDLFFFDGIEFCTNSVFNLNIYTSNGHKTEPSNSFATPAVTALVAKSCLESFDIDVLGVKQVLCSWFNLDFNYIAYNFRNG